MKKISACVALSLALAFLSLPYPVSPHAQTAPHIKGRALLVGITQYAQPEVRRAPGAEEDALVTKEFIKAQYGFDETEIHLLLNQRATRANLINEFRQWLIEGTAPGDRIFFLYSGHGSRLRDDNGDEPDGYDETLAPYDATLTGENQIRDDEINQWIEQLSGRIAVLVFDSCHSGTINRGTGSGQSGSAIGPRYLPSPEEFARLQAKSRGSNRSGGGIADYEVREIKQSRGDRQRARDLRLVEENLADSVSGIVVVSAAQAGQLAYPVVVDGTYRGALSYVFNEVKLDLGDKEEMTWDEVFDRLRNKRLAGYVKTRGVGTKKPGASASAQSSLDDADWQAASLVIETIP